MLCEVYMKLYPDNHSFCWGSEADWIHAWNFEGEKWYFKRSLFIVILCNFCGDTKVTVAALFPKFSLLSYDSPVYILAVHAHLFKYR